MLPLQIQKRQNNEIVPELPPGELFPTLEKPLKRRCESDIFGLGDCQGLAAISTVPCYLPMDQEYSWMVLCLTHLSPNDRRRVGSTEAHLLEGTLGTPTMLLGLTYRKTYYYYGQFMWAEPRETSPGVVMYQWQCTSSYGKWIDRETALMRMRDHLYRKR